MGKVYTPEVIGSGFQTTNSLNTNFTNIETALEDCLSRSGASPNAMSANLDMNGYQITNALAISTGNLSVNGSSVPGLSDIQALYAATQAASDSAGLSEVEASASAAAAAASAAGVNLPSIGTAGQILQVNSGATALENHTPTSTATASAIVRRDASARMQAADPSADADVATKAYVDGKGLVWQLVISSGTSLNMSNVPAAYQGAGLYGIGNSSGEIVATIAVRDSAVDASTGAGSFGTTNNDFNISEYTYDSVSGNFTNLTKKYESWAYVTSTSLLNPTLYKLVVA